MTTITLNRGVGLETLFSDTRSAFAAWKLRRDTRVALNDLSERDLEDIGMNRADIDAAVARI